jgi:predicted RNase H-like nuclease (RuvC/YqgF family)
MLNSFFSNEITQLNKKILDFGDLMEKLIAENQKMKIKLEEYEKKDLYFKRQMHEVSKVIDSNRDQERHPAQEIQRN